MAVEVFNFTEPPALPDGEDGVLYALGIEYVSDTDGNITGVEWYGPSNIDGTVHHYIFVFEKDSPTTGTLRGSKLFTPSGGGGTGVKQQIFFDAPVLNTSGIVYVAGVLAKHYTATTSYSYPITSSGGHLTAPAGVNGRFKVITTPDSVEFPDNVSGNQATYHVSPIFDPGGEVVDLTPAILDLIAVALDPVPGIVGINLSPAPIDFVALPLDPVPGIVSLTLTPAILDLTPVPVDPVPGLVSVNLTPAQLLLVAVPLSSGALTPRPYDILLEFSRPVIEVTLERTVIQVTLE